MKVTNRLVVVDRGGVISQEMLAPPPGGGVMILPLGITPSDVEQALGSRLATSEATFYPVNEIARAARESVAEQYPRLMFELIRDRGEGTSILEVLQSGNENLWWLGETSEKGALRSGLVNALYYLELVERAGRAADAEIALAVRDHNLAAVLATSPRIRSPDRSSREPRPTGRIAFSGLLLARRAWLVARLLFCKAVLSRATVTVVTRSLGRGGTMFFTSFPLNWVRPFAADAADRVYGDLPARLAEAGVVRYVALISLNPRELWRHRREMRASIARLGIHPIPVECTVREILGLLHPIEIRMITRAVGVAAKRQGWRYLSFDALPLLIEELQAGLGRNELPMNQLVVKAVRRIVKHVAPRDLVHWGEWQPVEKAIWYGTHGSATRAVSVQHSMSSAMFINYRFVPGELARPDKGQRDRGRMPLPDLFATTGHFARTAAVAGGYPSERATACGAVRYRRLMELATAPRNQRNTRRQLQLEDEGAVIVLATASKRADNLTMLKSFVYALRHSEVCRTVLVKCHPFCQMEAEIVDTIARSIPEVKAVPFDQGMPLHTLLAAADIMVGNSSASGVEAMALDVIPIFYHNPYLYDVNVLYSLESAVLLASGSTELSSALQMALAGGEGVDRLRRGAREQLPQLFFRLDLHAEERFMEFLQRPGLNKLGE